MKRLLKKMMTFNIGLISVFLVLLEVGNVSTVNAESGINPQLIQSNYESDDSIVADIVLTESPYNVDNTGVIDATATLRLALSTLKSAGGGTVFLPAGKYRITGSITLPNYITLVGEYRDPDTAEGDYGTVIIADIVPTTDSLPGLFRLQGSSGVVGLTIYYPNQNVDKVNAYPFTFEIMGGANTILEHMQFTIKNVTLINSYKGVAASRTVNSEVPIGTRDAHEGLVIENLKGSPLKIGIDAVNESDIGYYKQITFQSDYWSEFVKSTTDEILPKEEIEAFTKANGVGLKLGDLEWSPYYDIIVDGYLTGVHIISGTRIQPENPIDFMGGFYNLQITDCEYGLVVDELYSKWGMLVTKSQIEGRKVAIVNNDPYAYVRLTDVEVSGGISGNRILDSNIEVPTVNTHTPTYNKNHTRFFDANKDFGVVADPMVDCSLYLQNVLNTASANGGGVVYLKAGFYRVTKPIRIPENVELRGSMAVTHRDNLGLSGGTVILSYYDDPASDPDIDLALFTLEKDSGISGLRIVYPKNNLKLSEDIYSIDPSPYSIRVQGNGAYVVHVGLVNSFRGIHVVNADNVVIKGMPCLFFNIGIQIDESANTHIENIFSNATIATQSGYHSQYPTLFNDQGWSWRIANIWNYYTFTETHTRIIELNNAIGTNIMSVFTFCSSNVVTANDSDFTLIGSGADRMYRMGHVVRLNDSSMVMINQLKYNCPMVRIQESTFSIFGRMDLRLSADYSELDANVLNNEVMQDVTLRENTIYTPVVYSIDTLPQLDNDFVFDPVKVILKDG